MRCVEGWRVFNNWWDIRLKFLESRVSCTSFPRVLKVLPKRELRRYDSNLLGFNSVFFKLDSDLDFNSDLSKLVSHTESWMLWNSWVDEFPNWGISSWSFPLFLSNLLGLSTPCKISVLGLPRVCGRLEARMPFVILSEPMWSHQGKYTTLFNYKSLCFPTETLSY